MKKLRYLIEAAFLYIALGVFYVLGPCGASALGGWIGRTIGPRMAASRKALTNLRHALPGKSDDEYAAIVRDMWDNLGRVMAEYPHLERIARRHTVFNGFENIPQDKDKPCVFFSGHIANWEVPPSAFFIHGDVKADLVYREPNNPYAAKLLEKCRSMGGAFHMLPKSRTGTRGMVGALGSGRPLMMLIDQKYNEGISVPFMGRPAMTSDAFVRFARKFDAPLIPYRIERLGGCHFAVTALPPLALDGQSDEEVIGAAHRLLEGWIAEKPGQWLWLHRRWDSAALK